MWPFPTRRQVASRAIAEQTERINDALLRIKALEDNLAALEDKHERLRGRFYATRSPDNLPARSGKGAILAAMGYTPGRPIPPPTE